MDNFMISFMVLLVFIFGTRIISEKANKKLSVEKKAELIDLFSNTRTRTFGLIILIIGLYFLALKFQILPPSLTMALYLILLLAFIGYNTVAAQRKLKENDFPDEFIKSYLLTSTLRFIGILIFFAILMS